MSSTAHQVRSPLFAELLPLLRCPDCRGRLQEQNDGCVCVSCERRFPSLGGVPRFVHPLNYASSFGFQWRRYSRTQLDDVSQRASERNFVSKTGFTPQDLKGKLVLDVGCGMGRFAEVATRWGARVVGIDLSAAAEVAAHNLADRDFVAFQADVFSLPFALDTFDYIYSIGVLHHTPNCEQAVKVLPQYLRPGGTMAVWLYSGYNRWYRFSDLYRKITRRMPAHTLHASLQVAVPLLYSVDRALRLVPGVGRPLAGFVHYVFPVNRNPDAQWRVLDTFDWYSPEYQSKHTYEQVFRWFESCGLEDLHVVGVPVSVRGSKPFKA
jgi:SAM-dependent methyltransferase